MLTTTRLQLTALLLLARYGFDVPLPADVAHWFAFAWVAVLGALAGTADHPTVRVLVLTTYDSDADIVRAVEAGASG